MDRAADAGSLLGASAHQGFGGMKQSRSHEKPEGAVTTRLIEANIIETVYDGYITVAMAKEVDMALRALLAESPDAAWLIDASAATGVATVPGESRTAMFNLFRSRRFALVVRSTPLRMMAATFAFAFGVPMKTFERRSEAIDYLRSGG